MNNAPRIYTVTGPENQQQLVKAKSQAQAINAVVGGSYVAKPATTVEVAELVGGGAKVLDAAPKPVEG